tara:strand:- start:109 stop:360 length:252 start_codon:yes stop_codon:yes gene_type:complete
MKITKERLKQIIKEEIESVEEGARIYSSGVPSEHELPSSIRTKASRDLEYYSEMASKLPDGMEELKVKLEEVIGILGSLMEIE